MTKKKTKAVIGTSGWVYESWRRRFYPEDLPQKEYLEYYSHEFPTAEVNYSFYKLPSVETYRHWAEQVDKKFVFAVKASRYLTHMKKLKDPQEPWLNVTGRASELDGHLGPILLQFPGGWQKNIERLSEFLEFVSAQDEPKHRIAFEFRNDSWFEKDVFDLLEKHGAALCIADSSRFKRCDLLTADFTYIRYHGRENLYSDDYPKRILEQEAGKIRKFLSEGVDVYAYFNNDAQAHAVKNAKALTKLVEDCQDGRAA